MTPCFPIPAAGSCFACGRYHDGLHSPGSPPRALYCATCCPGHHKGDPPRCSFTLDELLALRVALDIGPSLEGKLLSSLPRLTPKQGAQALAIANGIPNLPPTLRNLLPRPVVKPA